MTASNPNLQAVLSPSSLNEQSTSSRWLRLDTWLITVAIWSFPGLAALSYYYLNQTVSGQPVNWSYAFTSTLPNWYFWAALTPTIMWLANRFRIERGNWKRNVLTVHLPALLVVLLVHSLVNLYLFRAAGLHEEVSLGLYRVHFMTRVHANVLAYITVLGVYYAYDYYRQLGVREKQAALLEVRVIEANLKALKMQLHPHFLFNTLNSIGALVRKNENRTAINMLAKLGDFLRLALESKAQQEIPLRQEMDFLQKYLDIEKIRFQERMVVEFDVDPAVANAYVPNMILQPLVENAVHHGIAPNAEAGKISVSAKLEGDNVVLEVRDDGRGMNGRSAKKKSRGGVGLANTRERLSNLYGANQEFVLGDGEEGGFVARMTIPFAVTPVFPTSEATA